MCIKQEEKLKVRSLQEGSTSHNGSPETSFSLRPITSTQTGVNFKNKISDHKITYTWSDVNVYCSTRTDRVWDRLMFKTGRTVAQKHILKDGKERKGNLKKKERIFIYVLRNSFVVFRNNCTFQYAERRIPANCL